MKLSPKQEKELKVWKYFMPPSMTSIPITDKDVENFFEWSERGLHKDKLNKGGMEGNGSVRTGFDALFQGKRWAGRRIHEIYEEGVLDGSMPYVVVLGCGMYSPKVPPEVKDFIKHEMFKGIDSQIIEDCYNNGDVIENFDG